MIDGSPTSGASDLAASRLLRHPVFLAALALWAINDHLLKGSGPALLTGKLSDAASLIAAPVLLAVGWVRIWPRPLRTECVLAITSVAMASVMAAINVWPPAALAYRVGLGALEWPFVALHTLLTRGFVPSSVRASLTCDPTDLVTLPFALIPSALLRRLRRRRDA